MPIFSLQTNVASNKISTDVLKEISKTVAQILHKPESYVAIHIQGNQIMTFAGTTDPCACGILKSLGGVGGKMNKDHAKVLYDIIGNSLGIPGNRMYIEFVDLSAANVSHNGTTFA